MWEIMVYWMEPDAAGNWRMRATIPEEKLPPNVMTAVDFVKQGRASHFTVNKVDNFANTFGGNLV